MKKKTLALILMVAASLGITACGEKNSGTGQAPQTAESSAEAGGAPAESSTMAESSGDVSMEALEQHPETPAEDFTYSVLEGFVYISGYHGEDNLVVIPEEIEGVPVTLVGGLSGSGIEGIRFSDTVETIGDSCFSFDDTLQYVICGENVKKIEEYAFAKCVSLREIRLNQGLETLEQQALSFYSDYMTDLYVPETVTEIEGAPFPMLGETTIHVKAGSAAEQFCKEKQETGFPDLKYVVE